MSRSFKRVPIFGILHERHSSEKFSKRIANRRLRRAVKVAVATDQEVFPEMLEMSDPWWWPCDGWRYRLNPAARNMRK